MAKKKPVRRREQMHVPAVETVPLAAEAVASMRLLGRAALDAVSRLCDADNGLLKDGCLSRQASGSSLLDMRGRLEALGSALQQAGPVLCRPQLDEATAQVAALASGHDRLRRVLLAQPEPLYEAPLNDVAAAIKKHGYELFDAANEIEDRLNEHAEAARQDARPAVEEGTPGAWPPSWWKLEHSPSDDSPEAFVEALAFEIKTLEGVMQLVHANRNKDLPSKHHALEVRHYRRLLKQLQCKGHFKEVPLPRVNAMTTARAARTLKRLQRDRRPSLDRELTSASAAIRSTANGINAKPKNRRPMYERDHTFLAWHEMTGSTTVGSPAAIRDKWNKDNSPKVTIDTVETGIKKARRERTAELSGES